MKYSILINTCDKFEDCWNPFFQLWSTYWKDCNGKIYLNTEYKDYSYPGVEITPIQGCLKNNIPLTERATWSQCLRWALESMDTDIVLYMQEDYFLKDTVKNDIVEKYVQLMTDNKDIDCIHLTDQSVKATTQRDYDNLYQVDMHHWSVVSCQASLWRKDKLLELTRDYESAWSFEWWGSKRANKLNHKYLIIDRNIVKLDVYEIIPYIFTGVIGGRWYKPVVELFNKHNIEVDYSKRGFFERKKQPFRQRVISKIKRIPLEFRNTIDLLMLQKRSK